MKYNIYLASFVLSMLIIIGCRRKTDTPSLPENISIESQIPDGISWASLLRDASDLSTLTIEPSPTERSILFSSSADTNKICLAHLALEIHGDLDHGFFSQVKETNGYVEATLAEATGAGVITWIWSANPVGQAVLYIDDAKTPIMQLPFNTLLAGMFLPVTYPYSALTAYGHNLHFPIIHKKSFKLAIRVKDRKELSSLFYHVAWNALDDKKTIHPFTMKSVQSSPELLDSLAKKITEPTLSTNQTIKIKKNFRLKPNNNVIFFQSNNAGMIQSINFHAKKKSELVDLWIAAYWDGEASASILCPISMMAGTSPQCEDISSLPCTIKGADITFRWQMPFDSKSKLICINKGNIPHSLNITTIISTKLKASSTLRFHANYTNNKHLSLSARNIITFGEISGPGRIVGCNLRVDSESSRWWGEGDEIIWLDNYTQPAWRGSGTEDYFGFAWCSDTTFDHPFQGQSRADGSRTDRRIAAMHRYHLLDRIPFHRFAKFTMEAWGLADGYMNYETSLLWYNQSTTNWIKWLPQ